MASGTELFYASNSVPANEIIDLGTISTAAEYTSRIFLRGTNPKVVYNKAYFAFTIAGITTNVILRIQGSLDGINFFNLDRTDKDYRYTANGTYGILWEDEDEVLYLRALFVSESGGTDATIATKVKVFKNS